MQHDAPLKVDPPSHVPAELVVDFDVYCPAGGKDNLHAAWKRLHGGPDIVWAPYHGGYWIPTRWEDIDYIQRSHDPFSMKDVTLPANTRPTRLLPLEADPPEHGPFRAILNPWFSPKKVASTKDFVHDLTVQLIEGFLPRGTCDFMSEFALQLPIAVFMRLTALPMSDRTILLKHAQMAARGTASERVEASRFMMAYLTPVIEARLLAPGDDLLSGVIHAKIAEQPLKYEDLMSMLLVILFGGLDTVACTLGFIAHFLANNVAHRRELRAHPAMIPHAVEELMRRFSPSSTARTMTRDFEYKGIHFKRGDKVYVAAILAGMDDRRYADADQIDFKRKDTMHASFGNGPHRCPGSGLARLEITMFLEEWLQRIPDFWLRPGDSPVFVTGQVNCIDRLALMWKP
jgi:cytochrome P450